MNEIEITVKKRFIQVAALMFLFIAGLIIIIIAVTAADNTEPYNAHTEPEPITESWIAESTEHIEYTEHTEQIIDLHDLPPDARDHIPREIYAEWKAEHYPETTEPPTTTQAPATARPTQPPTAPPPPTQPPTPAPTAPPRVLKEGEIVKGNATHYSVCCECDEPNTKKTANGHILQNKVQCYTATANWIPFGAVIEIDGVQYTIRDRGGRWFNTIGNIDIFVPEGRETAFKIGRLTNIEIKIVYLP